MSLYCLHVEFCIFPWNVTNDFSLVSFNCSVCEIICLEPHNCKLRATPLSDTRGKKLNLKMIFFLSMDKGERVLHILSRFLRKTAISLKKHCLKAVNGAEKQAVRGKTGDILRPGITFVEILSTGADIIILRKVALNSNDCSSHG